MKTLHFFTEFYYPASNSTSFYVTRIIQACADNWKGNVNVFCASPVPPKEILLNENVHITRFGDGGFSKNHLVGRLLKFTIQTFKFTFAAIFHVKKNDIVFAITNPAFMIIFLAIIRKFIRFRLIINVLDIFPEVLIPAKILKPDSLLYSLTLKIFNWAYNSIDNFIVIGRDMQEVVEKKIKDPSKIVMIPNWADTENIASVPKDDNPILKRLKLDNNFVFSVAGNMGRTQGLENILDALSITTFDEHTSFLFMGGGAKTKVLKEIVIKKDLKNVFVTGWIPEEEQNSMLSACDVAVISLAEGMYGLSVPSKSYFNMCAGKPLLLIADERSEIARVILENNIGWTVPPNNPEALANIFDKIRRTPRNELQQLGINARNTAESLFCEKKILPQYVSYILSQSEKELRG